MKNFAKVLLTLGLCLILVGLIILRSDEIATVFNNYLSPNPVQSKLNKNDYYRDYDFKFVQNTDDFTPNSYQDILNIYYTVINSGEDSFTFYCDKKYDNCLSDIQKLANNQVLLSNINNYVHPFHSYSHIETQYDSLGKVTINTTKVYNDSDIEKINNKVDELYKELFNSNSSTEDNIRNIHDYIINNSKYDSLRSDQNVFKYRSDNAYGPLFEGYAVCGGYTDLMQLFLEKMNIKSYRVSSDIHIWNAVNINNKWYHLDLTWDDPVADDNVDRLSHDYFLVDTDKLKSIEHTQHDFDQDVFLEFKKAN